MFPKAKRRNIKKKTKRRMIRMQEQEVILTQEGFNKLEEELNYLKTTKRT